MNNDLESARHAFELYLGEQAKKPQLIELVHHQIEHRDLLETALKMAQNNNPESVDYGLLQATRFIVQMNAMALVVFRNYVQKISDPGIRRKVEERKQELLIATLEDTGGSQDMATTLMSRIETLIEELESETTQQTSPSE